MPASIAGIAFAAWTDAPVNAADWEKLVASIQFAEPPMKSVPGKKPASGAVVVEADGHVWVVSPTNRFGGYTNTFPKGTIQTKSHLSLRGNAVKEVLEEAGLQVALTGFLCDSERSTTFTRYYIGRRIGGNPAAMEWESQAVHLVPAAMLTEFASHPNDKEVIAALLAMTKGAQ
jgi:8-oxo-dGTP pyrophosphatase MutT (NUDIX family)